MKKQFTLLILLMALFSANTYAGYTYNSSTGVKTWDFSNPNTSEWASNGWTADTRNNHRYNKSFSNSTDGVSMFQDLVFNGSFWIYDQGYLMIDANQESSISIPVNTGDIVLVTGYANSGARSATWTNVSNTPLAFQNGVKTAVRADASNSGHVNMAYNANRSLLIYKIEVIPSSYYETYKNNLNASLSFSATEKVGELIALNFDEPTLTRTNIPDNAQVTYKSSNEKIAKLSWSDGKIEPDVMFINTGIVGIHAEAIFAGEVIASASYTIKVEANEALYEIDNNTFTVTGEGKMPLRRIDQVPYITVELGDASNTNTAMVRKEDVGYVITVIDENGWRHCWATNNKPYQGTFYKIMPQVGGKLTINGSITGTNIAVVVEEDNLKTKYKEIANNNALHDISFDVQGGKTYYLYACTEATYENAGQKNDNQFGNKAWSMYQLHSFTFDADFGYDEKGLVYKNGKLYKTDGTEYSTTLTQNLKGTDGVTVEYTLDLLGDLTASDVTINSNGVFTVSENAKGGAFAVKAKVSDALKDYYMVTVPYKTYDWHFSATDNSKDVVEHNDYAQSSWDLTYKISRPNQTTRKYEELKAPVLCSGKSVTGNNAAYLPQTAGLLFVAGGKRFGTNTDMSYEGLKEYEDGKVKTQTVKVDGKDTEYEIYALDGEERHNMIEYFIYNKTKEDTYNYNTSLVTISRGAKMIIPSLKKGQYVRLRFQRHMINNGEIFTAYNVTDLKGTSMNEKRFKVGNDTYYLEFIVENDGDVAFQLIDEVTNWTNLYRVTVGEVGEFLPTNLSARCSARLVFNPDLTTSDFTTKHPYYSIESDNGATKEITLSTSWSNSSLDKFDYEIAGYKGNVNSTLNGNKLTVGGTGYVGVVSNAYQTCVDDASLKFVLDTDTFNLAVGTVNIQSYPHTWDFTKTGILTDTKTDLGTSFTNGTEAAWMTDNYYNLDLTEYPLWTKKDGEAYALNAYHLGMGGTTFAQGAQLQADNKPVKEAEGIGMFLNVSPKLANWTYETGTQGQAELEYGAGYIKFPDTKSSSRRMYLRIPSVSGYDVYLSASGSSEKVGEFDSAPFVNSQTADASNVKKEELSANNGEGTVYKFTGATGDLYIDVTGLTVYKIGVTKTYKKLNDYQGKSYATESRDHNVKYDLSGYFTGNKVSAFKVTDYKAEGDDSDAKIEDTEFKNVPLAGKLTLEPVEVADANTGLVLVGDGTGFSNEPLFVKDVNTNCDVIPNNYMVPSGGEIPANAYILTNVYYPKNADGTYSSTKKNGPLAFYKQISGQLKANLAYFDMPEEKTVTVTYAMNESETHKSGDAVSVGSGVATLTFGESGGADFGAAKANTSVSGFTAFTEGNGTNGNSTGGTFYTIVPQYKGKIEVAVVLNENKQFYVLEDGNALSAYNGVQVTNKYYGTYTFNVKAGSTYKVYCSGSKLGFYGFNYTYADPSADNTSTNFYMFKFIDEEENADMETEGVERMLTGDNNAMYSNKTYYTINGQKLSGRPTQKGIYICDGKKFYVK